MGFLIVLLLMKKRMFPLQGKLVLAGAEQKLGATLETRQ